MSVSYSTKDKENIQLNSSMLKIGPTGNGNRRVSVSISCFSVGPILESRNAHCRNHTDLIFLCNL